ncbi:uncharacterized protein LOC109597148 isoform X2 [Aethina tumida]|uniref:uncharacterized protein LOC109597148 isoform X2 n=1 Tax=Aethina tumida TaxID=116153 RepID=UPI0021483F1F|nr:uncharacterized protein LOC109597148 isoform X2 [Aethina tumida]
MKILFLFTFFVLIIGQTSANELKEWLARVMVRNQIQFLQIGLKRPNMNPLCIQSMEHLAVVAKEAEKCVLELLNFETNTICGIAKAHYQKCSEPLINTTVSCVDEVYKDVPSFLVNTVDNLITYVCKSKWKHFFELMNPCFWRKGDESLKTCEKLVNDKMDKMGKWAHNDENQSLTVSEISFSIR